MPTYVQASLERLRLIVVVVLATILTVLGIVFVVDTATSNALYIVTAIVVPAVILVFTLLLCCAGSRERINRFVRVHWTDDGGNYVDRNRLAIVYNTGVLVAINIVQWLALVFGFFASLILLVQAPAMTPERVQFIIEWTLLFITGAVLSFVLSERWEKYHNTQPSRPTSNIRVKI